MQSVLYTVTRTLQFLVAHLFVDLTSTVDSYSTLMLDKDTLHS